MEESPDSRKRPREGRGEVPVEPEASDLGSPATVGAEPVLQVPDTSPAATPGVSASPCASAVCESHGCEAQFFCRTCSTGLRLCVKCVPLHYGHDWDSFRADTADRERLGVVQSFWPPDLRSLPASAFPTSAAVAAELLRERSEPPVVGLVRTLGRRCIAEGDALPAEAEAASSAIRRAFSAVIAAAEVRRDTLLAHVADIEAAKRLAFDSKLEAFDATITAVEGLTHTWAAVGAAGGAELLARAAEFKADAVGHHAKLAPPSMRGIDATIHAVLDTSALMTMISSTGAVFETATARLSRQLLEVLPFRDSLLPLLRELRERTTIACSIGDALPHAGCLASTARVLARYGSSDAVVAAAAIDAGEGLLLCDDESRSVWLAASPGSPLREFVDGVLLALRTFPTEHTITDGALRVVTLVCAKQRNGLDDVSAWATLSSALSANAASTALMSILDLALCVVKSAQPACRGDTSAVIEAVTLCLAGNADLPLRVVSRAVALLRTLSSRPLSLSFSLRSAAGSALLTALPRFHRHELPTADAVAALAAISERGGLERVAECAAVLTSVGACPESVGVAKAFLVWVKTRALGWISGFCWPPEMSDTIGNTIKCHISDASLVADGVGVLYQVRREFVDKPVSRPMLTAMLCAISQFTRDEVVAIRALSVVEAATSTALPAGPPTAATQQALNIAIARDSMAISAITTAAAAAWAKPCEAASIALGVIDRLMGDYRGAIEAINAGVIGVALAVVEQFCVDVGASALRFEDRHPHAAASAAFRVMNSTRNGDVFQQSALSRYSSRVAAAVLTVLGRPQRSSLSCDALQVAELLASGPAGNLGPQFWHSVREFIRSSLRSRAGSEVGVCCWALYKFVSRGQLDPAGYFDDVVVALRDARQSISLSYWAAMALSVCCRPSATGAAPESDVREEAIAGAIRTVVNVTLEHHRHAKDPPNAGLAALNSLLALDPARGSRAAVAASVWAALASLLRRESLAGLGSASACEGRVTATCKAVVALTRAPLPDLAASVDAAVAVGIPAELAAVGLDLSLTPNARTVAHGAQAAFAAALKQAAGARAAAAAAKREGGAAGKQAVGAR